MLYEVLVLIQWNLFVIRRILFLILQAIPRLFVQRWHDHALKYQLGRGVLKRVVKLARLPLLNIPRNGREYHPLGLCQVMCRACIHISSFYQRLIAATLGPSATLRDSLSFELLKRVVEEGP